jgi:nucleoside-diphosphate-sugar epimerase
MRIVVVGGRGYIGSALVEYLQTNKGLLITIVDEKGGNFNSYQHLSVESLSNIDVVVWLAGHSSVAQSIADPVGALRNNLVDLYEFGRMLRSEQVFIYASSASVYNRLDSSLAVETDRLNTPLNAYDLSKKWFDEISLQLNTKVYGLRFGTVSGVSPVMRSDLIINSMVKSGIANGYINVKNEINNRSVLGVKDLISAVNTILFERPEVGIYNVASESSTIGEIGRRVARVLGVQLITKPSDGTYNFQVSTKKLESNTSWRPRETVESITQELLKGVML